MEFSQQEKLVYVKLLGRNYTEYGERWGVIFYHNIFFIFIFLQLYIFLGISSPTLFNYM